MTNADERAFTIEEVTDMDAAWPEIEPLVAGIIDYHRPWDQRPLRPNWAAVMREYMAGQCTTLLARGTGGEALGFLSGTIRTDYGIFEGIEGHIDNAFVVEHARRRGVGSALRERFEALGRERSGRDVTLDVALGNRLGDAFWRSAGYTAAMQAMRKSLEVPA